MGGAPSKGVKKIKHKKRKQKPGKLKIKKHEPAVLKEQTPPGLQKASGPQRAPSEQRHVRLLPLIARPWDIVHEEAAERWKKSQVAHGFQQFPTCTKKHSKDSQTVGHWHSSFCQDMNHEKARSVFVYQAHGGPTKYTLGYEKNQVLEKALNEAHLVNTIPCSGDHVACHMTYQSLDDQHYGIIVMFNLMNEDILYFFIEKAGSYSTVGIAVSPDTTMACLLLSRPDQDESTFEVQVYSRRPVAFEKSYLGATFELEYEVPGLHSVNGWPKVMFDPRYLSSRLGIINVDIVQNIRVTHYFMVYDLRRKRPVTMPKENYVSDTGEMDLLEAGYSLDGAWVHALVAHNIPEINHKHTRSLWFINSNTLDIVRTIELGVEYIDECYVNFMPSYSFCSRKMALHHRKSVKIYQLPRPRSLQALCRAVVLAEQKDDIDRLDVPQTVKDYLKYKPYIRQ